MKVCMRRLRVTCSFTDRVWFYLSDFKLADVKVKQLLQRKGIDCNCPAGDIQSSIIHSISKSDKKNQTLAKKNIFVLFHRKKSAGLSYTLKYEASIFCKKRIEYNCPTT